MYLDEEKNLEIPTQFCSRKYAHVNVKGFRQLSISAGRYLG